MIEDKDNFDNFNKTQLGENIRRVISRRNQTIKEASATIPLERTALSKIINGSRLIGVSNLLQLCSAYDITPNYLLGTYLYSPRNLSNNEFDELKILLNQFKPHELEEIYEIIKIISTKDYSG